MGIYEDVMASLTSGAGAVGDAVFGNMDRMQRDIARMDEIADQARRMGLPSPMHPRFAEMAPELASEYNALAQANTAISTSIGQGAMGAAARASANAAPAAPRPAQPMLPGFSPSSPQGGALPDAVQRMVRAGMSPSQIADEIARITGVDNIAVAPSRAVNGLAEQLRRQGMSPSQIAEEVARRAGVDDIGVIPGIKPPNLPPPPPSSGGTPQQPPLPGFNPIAPPAGAPTPPTMTPGVNPNAPAPRPPGPNPNQPFLPGFGPSPATGRGPLSRAANSPFAIPAIAAALGIGAATSAANRTPSSEASSGGSAMPPGGYEQPLMPGRQEIHDDQVERERQEDYVRRRREAQLQTEALEAANAYANAQRAELERRLANADMTDSQKEAARSALERELASIREGGANQRNQDDIQSRERITGMTEAGANERNRATIESNERQTGMREAGEDRRTGVREAGENTRTVFRGDVEMRGQDQRAREAQDNFVTQTIANNVAAGRLSVEKANKMIADYVAMAKLPTDILKQVSDSIQPFLPYMRNGNPGDIPAGFEKGGARDALAKLAGVKTSGQRAGYSDFNLADVAAQYGGGPPAAPPKPLDVQSIYGAIPDVNTNPDAYRGQSASSTQLARPMLGGGEQPPPMVQNLMPQTVTPPMGEDVQQRILAGLGQ